MEKESTITNNIDLSVRVISPEDPLSAAVKDLYESSFPANERVPYESLFRGFYAEGEMLAFLDGDIFAGMTFLLAFEDITHILYLAVPENLRDKGYGSVILQKIRELHQGQRIIADLEQPEADVPNEAQREKRTAFYEKNGYGYKEIKYRWENEDYRIMSNGGDVTFDEFRRFWQFFLERPSNDR